MTVINDVLGVETGAFRIKLSGRGSSPRIGRLYVLCRSLPRRSSPHGVRIHAEHGADPRVREAVVLPPAELPPIDPEILVRAQMALRMQSSGGWTGACSAIACRSWPRSPGSRIGTSPGLQRRPRHRPGRLASITTKVASITTKEGTQGDRGGGSSRAVWASHEGPLAPVTTAAISGKQFDLEPARSRCWVGVWASDADRQLGLRRGDREEYEIESTKRLVDSQASGSASFRGRGAAGHVSG